MISVTDARLICFHLAKVKPIAINKNTGMTGESGLNSSIVLGRRFNVQYSTYFDLLGTAEAQSLTLNAEL